MTELPKSLASVYSPVSIGSLDLPHRIMMGAMHLCLESAPDAGERLAAFYRERALADAGLICTGGWAVSPEGASDSSYGLISDRAGSKALARIAAAAHGTDAAIALQLFHAGRYAREEGPGEVVAPSAIASRIFGATPRELATDEVWEVIDSFAFAARRARELGFAAVEVMGSEGYLVDQFLSAETNRREDEWGGDAERRMRFGVELARAVRRATGEDFPVFYRITGTELLPRSRSFEQVERFALALRDAGVDALNIGVGWHESRVPTVQGPVPAGTWAPWAEAIGDSLDGGAAVIVGNRINRLEHAAALLDRGRIDLVSMSRPFLADPGLIAKGRSGSSLNVCISCNQACIDRSISGDSVSCLVNPRAGFELEFPPGALAATGRYAVIGGGPAGLEAARALASGGGTVELFETGTELGGQFRFARMVPGKADYGATIRHLEAELARFGARIHLERPVLDSDAELLGGFDGIVLATGVIPRRIDLPGADRDNVVDYAEAFAGGVTPGERIAIIGAGGIGVDLAHWLSAEEATEGSDRDRFLRRYSISPPGASSFEAGVDETERVGAAAITLLRRQGRIGAGIGPTTRWVWLDYLRRAGVEMRSGLSYRRISGDGIEILNQDGETELIGAECVIVAAGQEKNNALRPLLERCGVPFVVVGGAADARRLTAVRAFAEGLRGATQLIETGTAGR